jgi:cytochrome c553
MLRAPIRGLLALALIGLASRSLGAPPIEERLGACLACHGAGGQSANPKVPSLGGQHAPYLVIQLFLFREKLRQAVPMNDNTKDLGDAELQKIADLLATMPAPKALSDPADPARIARARRLVTSNRCDVCHGADLSGRDTIPRIAAQREDYLAQTLHAYKSNARPGYDASMAEVLQPVSDADIDDLAYFLARAR